MHTKDSVVIQESPGGHWNIWSNGCKVDDGHFRRAGDAQEYCNEQGWEIEAIRKHEPPRKSSGMTSRNRTGVWYGGCD